MKNIKNKEYKRKDASYIAAAAVVAHATKDVQVEDHYLF